MDGKIYADMATAYDKYMAAKQARDMYVYGGDASQDLRTAAQALTTATTEMQKTVLSSDVTYATVTDSSGATVASDYANGCCTTAATCASLTMWLVPGTMMTAPSSGSKSL